MKRLHPNRKPFLEWLLKTRPTAAIAVSDLAGEMAQDRCWPARGTLEIFRRHLHKHNAPIEAQVALGYAYRSWMMGNAQYVAQEPGPVQLTRADRYYDVATCPYCGSKVYLDREDEPIVPSEEDGTLLLHCSDCGESFKGFPRPQAKRKSIMGLPI